MGKARDEWLRLISKQRDECQSRVWMAAMQREKWLSRKMDGKGERWVGNQRDGCYKDRWVAEQKYGCDSRQMGGCSGRWVAKKTNGWLAERWVAGQKDG